MKAFDSRHIGVFDINFDTGEQYWSRELRRILRLSETGAPDLSVLLERVHPEDRAAVLRFAMEPFQEKCPPHRSLEHRLLDPDGTVRWVHLETGAAFRPGSAGDVIRVIGLVIEIDRPKDPKLNGKYLRSVCNRDAAEVSLAAK